MTQTTLRKWMKKMDVFDPYVEQILIEEGIEDPINDFKKVIQPQWDHIKKQTFNKSELEEQFYIENHAKERLEKKMRKLEKYWRSHLTLPENKQHFRLLKRLKIGDRVEIKKGMFGVIKYNGIGPISNSSSSSNLKGQVLGIELDIAIPSGHDGQNLFICKKGHGYFSPRWRIKNVIKPKQQPSKKLSVMERMEQKFEEEQMKMLEEKETEMEEQKEEQLPHESVIPVHTNNSNVKEYSNVHKVDLDFLDKMNKIEKAEMIISKSKEPFWGELIKKLYDEGFSIEVMEEAFKRAHQGFKWSGQIQIWYQDTKPSCIDQLQFANGDGKSEYVKKVIEKLIEDNCKDKTPPPVEQVMDDKKENVE
eukprot:461123_1